MTWGFLPDNNFIVMKNRILTGLQQFGNYHPQVVVREMYRWFKHLKWDVNPKGKASCYTCLLQVRKNATGCHSHSKELAEKLLQPEVIMVLEVLTKFETPEMAKICDCAKSTLEIAEQWKLIEKEDDSEDES
ncbi:hypothetical protein DAPPUDRAFT_328416 [Daphnia pulex]|uniref:Uncharacterized protein n=1 Tax=Daphnia pulex TaxID=6669 RepID=E9HDL9_DAPPU|nr:hypothetical protein DAPPUDRAFT_328416 [Daphnia pulex]|eukprot:EFX70168.1 hypothetical protein DAPPUDRAFT_328416 [Daphnia pulex]